MYSFDTARAWALLGVIGTVLLFLICIFCAGAGHGTYLPLEFFFPVAMIPANFREQIACAPVVLSLLYYPAIGFALGYVRKSPNFVNYLIAATMVHTSLVVIALATYFKYRR